MTSDQVGYVCIAFMAGVVLMIQVHFLVVLPLLEKQREAAKARIEELQKEVAGVRRKRCDAELLKEIHDCEVRVKDLERIEELESLTESLKLDIAGLRARLKQSDEAYTKTHNDWTSCSANLANAKQEIVQRQVTIEEQEKEIDAKDAEVERLKAELSVWTMPHPYHPTHLATVGSANAIVKK